MIGPMEYKCGRGWREEMAKFLKGRNITYFDPYKKPFVNAVEEDENTHKALYAAMEKGQDMFGLESDGLIKGYDWVASHMKQVRSFDLSMVDRSDFIICYIDPSVPTFGTIEELVTAVRMKRPIFVVVEGGKSKTPLWVMGMLPHKYIYDTFEQVRDMLSKIDDGEVTIDSDRWRLLKPELR